MIERGARRIAQRIDAGAGVRDEHVVPAGVLDEVGPERAAGRVDPLEQRVVDRPRAPVREERRLPSPSVDDELDLMAERARRRRAPAGLHRLHVGTPRSDEGQRLVVDLRDVDDHAAGGGLRPRRRPDSQNPRSAWSIRRSSEPNGATSPNTSQSQPVPIHRAAVTESGMFRANRLRSSPFAPKISTAEVKRDAARAVRFQMVNAASGTGSGLVRDRGRRGPRVELGVYLLEGQVELAVQVLGMLGRPHGIAGRHETPPRFVAQRRQGKIQGRGRRQDGAQGREEAGHRIGTAEPVHQPLPAEGEDAPQQAQEQRWRERRPSGADGESRRESGATAAAARRAARAGGPANGPGRRPSAARWPMPSMRWPTRVRAAERFGPGRTVAGTCAGGPSMRWPPCPAEGGGEARAARSSAAAFPAAGTGARA